MSDFSINFQSVVTFFDLDTVYSLPKAVHQRSMPQLAQSFFYAPPRLGLGPARDSFDEESFHQHLAGVQLGQTRPQPEFLAAGANANVSPTRMDEVVYGHKTGLRHGESTPGAGPSAEEMRFASTGERGRGRVDWSPNHYSVVGSAALHLQSVSPTRPAVPLSASFGAAGVGGVDQGARSPTLPGWSAGRNTHLGVSTFGGNSPTHLEDYSRKQVDMQRYADLTVSTKRESALAYTTLRDSGRAYSPGIVQDSDAPYSPPRPTLRVNPDRGHSNFEFEFEPHQLGPTNKSGSPLKNPREFAGRATFSSVSISHEHPPHPAHSPSRTHAGRTTGTSYDFYDGASVLAPNVRERVDGLLVPAGRTAATE